MLSRICRSIGRQFKRSVDALITTLTPDNTFSVTSKSVLYFKKGLRVKIRTQNVYNGIKKLRNTDNSQSGHFDPAKQVTEKCPALQINEMRID